MLRETYDPVLVVSSFVVAVLGSYTALNLAPRVITRTGKVRISWLLIAALTQGTGIWGMHFTGMLALKLPVPVVYDTPLVFLSFLVASLGSLLALWLTSREKISSKLLIAGGISVGLGIAGLHYIDMAAMRMPARTHYTGPAVWLSVAIAVLFGFLSLRISRMHRTDNMRGSPASKIIGALVMGAAIIGQHYTAMAGADFFPAQMAVDLTGMGAIPTARLPGYVLAATVVTLLGSLYAAGLDRRSRARVEIAHRLLNAQEDERRRISRGLHDEVGALLTAIKMNVERIGAGEPPAPIVADSVSLLDRALNEVRSLSVDLRPSVLDDIGLVPAVESFAQRQATRAGYVLHFQHELGNERLPQLIETAIFRIVQQALTNVARHANASRVEIDITRTRGFVQLTVADNGAGFDAQAARTRATTGESIGLLSMNELASLAGGKLSIVSSLGAGTQVIVNFEIGAS